MFRKILHIDLDAFFCSVEELHNPNLIDKPFVVGGKPKERGVVSSCSYKARQYGIHSAMPMARAQKLCPNLRILPPRHNAYRKASEAVMQILLRWTETIEQISIDEAFLDLSDLDESIENIARSIQKTIFHEMALPSSFGVATNKLIAKIANNIGKVSSDFNGPPQAITIVPAGSEAKFLENLPIETLWGVGPKTAEKLVANKIFTIGKLAKIPISQLEALLGKNCGELLLRAKGIDNRPINPFREPKSFSNEITFPKDINDYQVLSNTIHDLSDKVSERLVMSNKMGNTIKIKIRWADFSTITRQKTQSVPTNESSVIYDEALKLFQKHWIQGSEIRLLGIGVSGITNTYRQLGLWGDHSNFVYPFPPKLIKAIKGIQTKYGGNIIRIGSGQNSKD